MLFHQNINYSVIHFILFCGKSFSWKIPGFISQWNPDSPCILYAYKASLPTDSVGAAGVGVGAGCCLLQQRLSSLIKNKAWFRGNLGSDKIVCTRLSTKFYRAAKKYLIRLKGYFSSQARNKTNQKKENARILLIIKM